MTDSKTLKGIDDSSARLIKNVLAGKNGYGIDIEIIFKTKSQGWVMMEFLKCEDRPDVNPCSSHPKRYWKNWRKFAKLWEITKKLNSKLYLVNYEEKEINKYGKFRIMEVNMDIEPTQDTIIVTKDIVACGSFEDFQKFYLSINNDI